MIKIMLKVGIDFKQLEKYRKIQYFLMTGQQQHDEKKSRLRAFARTRAKKPNFFKFEIPNKQIDTHYCRYSMNCAHKFL